MEWQRFPVTARNRKLFEAFAQEVWDSGGDGDGIVVVRADVPLDVTFMADQFEDWLMEVAPEKTYERCDQGVGYVSFHHGEESFFFVSEERQGELTFSWFDIKLMVYSDSNFDFRNWRAES